MTPEKQRIAIAEACGAKWYRWGDDPDAMLFLCMPAEWLGRGSFVLSSRKPNELFRADKVPDYPSDLNAMHEVEKMLTGSRSLFCQYVSNLLGLRHGEPFDPDAVYGEGIWFDILHATAAQRAEAFLRTLGKWEDDQ